MTDMLFILQPFPIENLQRSYPVFQIPRPFQEIFYISMEIYYILFRLKKKKKKHTITFGFEKQIDQYYWNKLIYNTMSTYGPK